MRVAIHSRGAAQRGVFSVSGSCVREPKVATGQRTRVIVPTAQRHDDTEGRVCSVLALESSTDGIEKCLVTLVAAVIRNDLSSRLRYSSPFVLQFT